MSDSLEAISNLKNGDTCYPTGRSDESVTKTHGGIYPYYLLDRHGHEQCFCDAKSCSAWMSGDRNDLVRGIHYV